MKICFTIDIECLEPKICHTIYKLSCLPFIPPIGLKMYLDDCEHEVKTVFWSHADCELSVTLDSFIFDTPEETEEELGKWLSDGWTDH